MSAGSGSAERSSVVREIRIPTGYTADQPAPEPAERQAVRDAIATLPADQRIAVVLRFYLDLSVDEIADRTHARAGTVEIPTSQRAAKPASRVRGSRPMTEPTLTPRFERDLRDILVEPVPADAPARLRASIADLHVAPPRRRVVAWRLPAAAAVLGVAAVVVAIAAVPIWAASGGSVAVAVCRGS